MAEEKRIPTSSNGQITHIENREMIKVTGVTDVASFDEHAVDVETELGRMIVRGDGLKIVRLSLEQHELCLSGYICGCEYEDKARSSKNIFSRIFS